MADGNLEAEGLSEIERAVLRAAERGEVYRTEWRFGFALPADILPIDGQADAEAAESAAPISATPIPASEATRAHDAEDDAPTPEAVECALLDGVPHPLEAAPAVSAEFIRKFLTGLIPGAGEPVQGLMLHGVRVTGALAINFARGPEGSGLPLLSFTHCYFERTVSAQRARLQGLEFWSCLLPGLNAEFLALTGPLGLFDTVITEPGEATISLAWAQIEGALGATRLAGGPGVERIRIHLHQASVRGLCMIDQIGDLDDPDTCAVALEIWESSFSASVDLRNSAFSTINGRALRSDSRVQLNGSRIDGELSSPGAHIAGDLCCDNLRMRTADANIDLTGAQIEGTLRCDGLIYEEGGNGIQLASARIGGAILMREARIVGAIHLMLARVEGGWELDGTHLISLEADGVVIAARESVFGGSVWMRGLGARKFEATGHINLRRTRIEGNLEVADAICKIRPGGARDISAPACFAALYARGIHVAGDLHLGGSEAPAVFEGPVSIDRCEIGGDLDMTGAAFTHATPPTPLLSLRDGRIAGQLIARGFAEEPVTQGVIDLTGLHVGVLSDDDGQGWGKWRGWLGSKLGGKPDVRLRLNGFVYDRLDSKRNPGRLWQLRKRWLDGQDMAIDGGKVFHSQPYEQLAKTLRADGREEDARRIALEKRSARRSRGRLNPWDWLVSFLYHHTFGHGLSPFRAAVTLAVFWAIGFGGLFYAHRLGKIVHLTPPNPGTACTDYNPALHAVQLMVPLSNLSSGDCGINPAEMLWKAGEFGYSILGALLLALAVITFSGVTRNELSR